MQNIEKIKNVLAFYVLVNKLKTTIVDEINNYSIADSIFGSIVLAIAMNSEFKVTDNVGNLISMMVMDEIVKLNPSYSINDNLGQAKQLNKEIAKDYPLRTKEDILIAKYKELDIALTKLILEGDNVLDYSDLLKEGLKLLMPKDSTQQFKYEKIFKFYYLNFKLKNKIRSGWDNKHWNIKADRLEKISEHVVETIALAIKMDSEFGYSKDSNIRRKINLDYVVKQLAIHEVGEALIGDITPFDGMTPIQKEEVEHEAMIKVVGTLDEKDELLKLLFEFDKKISNEALFAYFCDKMDADLQSKFYQDSGLHNSLDNQQNNCVIKSEKVKQMIKNGAKTAFDIWYEWDKDIYQDNKTFPEFAHLLKMTKDNNLLMTDSRIIK